MSRALEAMVFLSLATGLHVGFWSVSAPTSGTTATGRPGQGEVTLSAATPQHAALARAWQNPPDVSGLPLHPQETALPPEPQMPAQRPDAVLALPPAPLVAAAPSDATPRRLPDTPHALPRMAPLSDAPDAPPPPAAQEPIPSPQREATQPGRPDPPDAPGVPTPDDAAHADTTAPSPPAPAAKKRAVTAKPQSAPKATQSAGGTPAKPASGEARKDATNAPSAANRDALQAEWGARIQRKIHRRLVYPRGASGSGTARVTLTVDRSGALTGLRLTASSGVEQFDAAALNAVRRAGRFPAAPAGLSGAQHTFTLALVFRR